MRRWIAEPTNIVLIVALVTTVFGLYAAYKPPQNGTILAFAGTMWLTWGTILKERRQRRRDVDDDEEDLE